MQNTLGFTALMNACQEGHAKVADVLIEKGAMVEYHNKVRLLVQLKQHISIQCVHVVQYWHSIDIAVFNWLVIFSVLQEGATPLIMASQDGCDDVVQLLLDRGARIDHPAKVAISSAFPLK